MDNAITPQKKQQSKVYYFPEDSSQMTVEKDDFGKHFPNERSLWEAFCNGNTQAFNTIYNQYVQHLFRYGCQITNDRELIQDAIHALFLDFRSRESKPPTIISIKSYLLKAFYRTLLRMLKQESRFSRLIGNTYEIDLKLSFDPHASLIEPAFSQQQQKELTKALNQLPKKQKEAMVYYFYEGMDYEEIAFIMGMNRVHSARKLIYKAINYLKSELGDKQGSVDLLGLLPFILLSNLHFLLDNVNC